MHKKSLVTFCVAITSLHLVAAEPSAFGAGNLDSSTPYGLTSSEKTVLQNKTKLKKIVINNNNQANKVESLRERIDGLQSIVESLSRKAQNNKKTLSQLENTNEEKLKHSDEYGKRLGEVTEENSKLIAKNILLLENLSEIVETINKTYVSKSEFNSLVSDVNAFKALVAKELKGTATVSATSDLSTMSNVEIAKKAKDFYNRQYYTKGIEYYSHLILKKYKPANAHYMIGQMYFKRKNYAKAISFYKESASLYSKASYMPELMLHTAISMENTGDKKNAEKFYSGIIAKFPESPQAIDANISLKKF